MNNTHDSQIRVVHYLLESLSQHLGMNHLECLMSKVPSIQEKRVIDTTLSLVYTLQLSVSKTLHSQSHFSLTRNKAAFKDPTKQLNGLRALWQWIQDKSEMESRYS